MQNIPGAQGDPGVDGLNGVNGLDAYTSTTDAFTMPAEGATVSVPVVSSDWMVVGQVVFVAVGGAVGWMEVTAKADSQHATLLNLEDTATSAYVDNSPPGTVFAPGAVVSPGGLQGPAGTAGAGGAPSDATYITQTPTGGGALPNEVVLSALGATGLLHVTNVTGALAVKAEGVANGAHAANSAGLTNGDAVFASATGIETKTAANARTALGLGTMATQAANAVAITGGSVAGITDLAIADGGTAASTAAAARSNLSLNRVTQDIIILRDQKASGTDGGTFTSGAWQTRDLNTEVCDTGGHCSLAGNQFTLADGVYRIWVTAPAHRVDQHQLRLFDVVAAAVVTEGGVLAYGANADTVTTADDITLATLIFRFTVTGGPRAYRIEHRCATTRATDGFGSANSFGGPEIYTEVRLEREVG